LPYAAIALKEGCSQLCRKYAHSLHSRVVVVSRFILRPWGFEDQSAGSWREKYALGFTRVARVVPQETARQACQLRFKKRNAQAAYQLSCPGKFGLFIRAAHGKQTLEAGTNEG
jgi:hypothetical protein